VRRVSDVLTPSRARVNASSISPVDGGLYLKRQSKEEFFNSRLIVETNLPVGTVVAKITSAHPTLNQQRTCGGSKWLVVLRITTEPGKRTGVA